MERPKDFLFDFSPKTSLTLMSQGIKQFSPVTYFGHLDEVVGNLATVIGLSSYVHVGSRVRIDTASGEDVLGEVVGFRGERVFIMGYARLEGAGPGARVDVLEQQAQIFPHDNWKGRIIDAFARPLDQKGPLPIGMCSYLLKATPPPAVLRSRVGSAIDVGVKAVNAFVTCCQGQRMGLFSGSGVGKSVLISQLTKFSSCDTVVIGLIGERGREVREFIEEQLGEEGLKRAVVVIATSDAPALERRQAAYVTLAIAEYFRDQGQHVLCVVDNITRVAMAQREIGLAMGEPPTTKGYTPSVLSELPSLLERAGPGPEGTGSITAFFAVLVESDDMNDIIADTVRGILDGHIILSRGIAERGRFPAVDVLKSLSRTMPYALPEEYRAPVAQARRILATYEDMQELIRLGAYQAGTSAEVDQAVRFYPRLEEFLNQAPHEKYTFEDTLRQLSAMVRSA